MATIVTEGIGTFATKATPALGYPSVASNGTCFVAVSFDGVTNPVLRSTDGNTWAQVSAGTASQEWNFVMWVESLTLFVAFSGTSGTGSNVMTSPTGETWTLRTAADGNWIAAVWNGTGIVALGESGAVMTSSNGTAWSSETPTGLDTGLKTMAYGDGVYVAMDVMGTVWTSANGIAWTERDTLTNIVTPRVVWSEGLGKFFALVEEEFEVTGAGVYESATGLTWALREFGVGAPSALNVLFVSPTGSLVAGDEFSTEYFTSTDGTTWALGAWLAGDWAAGVWDATLGVAVVGYNYDSLAVQFASGDEGLPRVTGLTYLEGEDVSVVADGVVLGSPNNPAYDTFTVTGGEITLPAGTYTSVTVGLPYVTDIQTLDLDGANTSRMDSAINITRVGLWVEDTIPPFVANQEPTGDTVTTMNRMLATNASGTVVTTAISGYREVQVDGAFTRGGKIFIRQVDPSPLTVLAIIPQGQFGRS